eukprot:s824_g19.t2
MTGHTSARSASLFVVQDLSSHRLTECYFASFPSPENGIPVVPVAAKDPPPEEASSGFAFVRETLHELTGIQSCIAGMKDELKQLRSDLEREQTVRKEETETVRRLLTRNINEESQMRASLDSKLEAFQNLSKTWISSLGKDVMASKERLNSLDSIAEQHSTSLLAHEERLMISDSAIALRCTVTDYKSLATSLAELQAEVVRDRATAQASVDTAVASKGHGVVERCYPGEIPSTIFISHNHSDHAGELPVVLAVEGLQKQRPMCVIAETEVLARLQVYRMHEMRSMGRDMGDFAAWVPAPEGELVTVQSEAGPLRLTSHRAQHSELCFGARLDIGNNSIGWTSDSGFSPTLLRALRRPKLLLIDARKAGNV